MSDRDLIAEVSAYLGEQLARKRDHGALEPDTPLISSGRLSSVDVLGLVAFLEDELGVEIAAHEISADHMDTVRSVVALVAGRAGGGGGTP